MRKHPPIQVFLLAALTAWPSYAVAQEECSTEKVNKTCTLTIDRSYPLAVPTIQMRHGQVVQVKIKHPLPFETLSLDLQSAQAIAGTDQTAGLVNAVLPNMKGLLFQTQINQGILEVMQANPNLQPQAADPPPVVTAKQNISKLISDSVGALADFDDFARDSITVYAQLNEVLQPITPVLLKESIPGEPPASRRLSDIPVSKQFPRPWISREYGDWREAMLCELVQQECPADVQLSVSGLLSNGAKLSTELGPCPNPAQPQLISCEIATIQAEVGAIAVQAQKDALSDFVNQFLIIAALLNADSAAATTIYKDLSNYVVNIAYSKAISTPEPLGDITDPLDRRHNMNAQLWKPLGRQVVYAINAVNEVGVPAASVLTTTQKKSLLTITVLYADPIFEVSTGALFSMLPNRSFVNQTTVTQNQGGSPTQGNVVITQMISSPTVVVFAGGNWRLGHDFIWPDKRRGAVYFTTTGGVNVNNNAAEFGAGLSFSWRSLMFSVLNDWGHDVRLTQGEFIGEVWCNQTAASATVPKCSGAPPAPSTEKYWKGTVAFGISVRVPTLFAGSSSAASGGTGGSSSH